MVKLRLKRMGKKKKPFYRIVAADSRAARDGRFIEVVGTYDPIAKPHVVECKEERIFHWLSNGAQPTDTVRSLFRGKGLWLKWTLIKQGADEAKIASEMEAWEKLQVEKAKRAEAKVAKTTSEKAKKKVAEGEEAKKAEEVTKEVGAETSTPVEAAAEETKTEAASEEVAAAEPIEEVETKKSAPVDEVVEETKKKTTPKKTTKKENNENEKK